MAERSERRKTGETAEAQVSLNLADIKELFSLMKANDIAELDIEQKGAKIHIVSTRAQQYVQQAPMQQLVPMMSAVTGPAPAAPAAVSAPQAAELTATAAAPQPKAAEPAVPSNLKTILSPMVGTFYRAPAPDASPFVNVGDPVKEDTVLCIIEAMKLMNELKAECRGRIQKILVENGLPVEYNQPLFLIEPE